MRRHTILSLAAVLFGTAPSVASACAQTPVDGRIVRVVYKFTSGGTWGFHLAHMTDGRYCVRFGDPGRLGLRIIDRVADICFDNIPGTVDRSHESRSQAFDVRERGKVITLISYQKGSIRAAGNEIVLDISSCTKVEGVEKEADCSPNRYLLSINGADCSAEVTLSGPARLAQPPICEHYGAQSNRP
jgi:hypothetical protein